MTRGSGRSPALEARGLTVRYFGRGVDALSDVDLEVQPGELVGLAGRNGAGKSTLALTAAGFIPRIVRADTSGDVRAFGTSVVVEHGGKHEQRVGIVFASPANQLSATKTTVREELAFGLENVGLPRAEMDGRIEATLVELGIDHLAERYPLHLSGGEQQRVAIASILIMGMRVLVLDEPTAQLDPSSTRTVASLLEDLAADGIGVLVAEHDADVLGRTVRCLVIEQGRMVADGLPGEVLAPATLTPLGLPAPTMAILAARAGVSAADAFDDAAVAAGLLAARGDVSAEVARRRADAATAWAPASATSSITWAPIRAHEPTGVSVNGLIHRYADGAEALRGVDLAIGAGQSVAIIGQNGSGKTTLVKHFNGLLAPTAGRVTIGDMPAAGKRVDELAATVGFVFQDADDQLFSRSVEREVAFGPHNLHLPAERSDELVRQALVAIGLDGERATNPYDLDVSSRKLVALASILAMDPAVIVLDEPTTGQDWPGVARVGAIVDAMHAAGRTVIAITHDMEFAAAHFERVVVMRTGMVVADGPPEIVFAPTNHDLLASTGLLPPVTARLAARLGWATAPLSVEALLARA